MAAVRQRLPHLLVKGTATPEPYTYPHKVRGGAIPTPARDRAAHAHVLLSAMDRARHALGTLHAQRKAVGVSGDRGMYLEFESDPGFELELRSLDRSRQGIELMAVRDRGNVTLATVFVAEGKLRTLERLISAYRDAESIGGEPRNRTFVESVRDIHQAVLTSFWTDDSSLFPKQGASIWWEVWLRTGQRRDEIVQEFASLAGAVGMSMKRGVIRFVDRTVVLAFGTPEEMSASVALLDCIAELRLAKESPEFFMALEAWEQAKWTHDLLARLRLPEGHAPAVCVLDTGINNGHPLLADSLADDDLLSCDAAWGVADHHGHGTEMAGLALLGDLVNPLSHNLPVPLEHCLESVKILPPPLQWNDPDLYGSLTGEAVGRIEAAQPARARVFCMAVSAPDFRDRGRPSSWSAALDALAAGADDDYRRLIVLSAGNVARDDWRHYPDGNDTDHVHDPGQAWNALTVGACTEKTTFDTRTFPGWTPLARPGGLSASSTTSVAWQGQWPYKPDIVLEGGNAIREPGTGAVETDHSLLLLTTHWQLSRRLLTTTGDTSAAAAQTARMAAILMARYPNYWPETIRGLLVHSADWTAEMRRSAPLLAGSRTRLLLRRYGYGVPNLQVACWSASNALTLIAEDQLFPFEKPESAVRTKDMNLHALPWPSAELSRLGRTPVELRVTLSYFVEPNPARRGWIRKFAYQSHGLRFAIRGRSESLDDFRARVSKDAQDDEGDKKRQVDPGWVVGGMVRNRGSIHSDRWKGIAADLALRHHIAVFPVGGWWREQPQSQRWSRPARYALIVSIKAPKVATDIYTPVAQKIRLQATIAT